MLIARDAEIERLRQIIRELQRHRFGRALRRYPRTSFSSPWKRPSRWRSQILRHLRKTRRRQKHSGSQSVVQTAARFPPICRGSRR